MRLFWFAFVICVLVAAIAAPRVAYAQAPRTWVSGVGDDVNPCSRTAPCKTFAGAISKTAAGGEISVLDPGGFGAVTITKSISIINDNSGEAGILASGTNGIVINAGPNDVVQIRGLVIDGGPPTAPGLNGIRFLVGKALIVSNAVIKNFAGASPNGFGISFQPSTSAAQLTVTDTIINNNGTGSTGGAILVKPTGSGSAKAAIRNVKMVSNVSGILGDGTGSSGNGISLYIQDSVIANNALLAAGLLVPVGGQGANMVIDSTGIFSNGTGVSANGSATGALVNNSTITVNGIGVSTANGGSVFSSKTNNLFNNGVNGSFTPPTIAQL